MGIIHKEAETEKAASAEEFGDLKRTENLSMDSGKEGK